MPRTDKEQDKQYHQEWYQKNKERIKERQHKYYREHVELKKALRHKYYLAHKTERREKNRLYMQKFRSMTRLKAIELLGGRCKRCGLTDTDVLTLHHSTPLRRQLKRIITNSAREWLKALRSKGEGFELLCSNCHMKATRRQFADGEFKYLGRKANPLVTLTP